LDAGIGKRLNCHPALWKAGKIGQLWICPAALVILGRGLENAIMNFDRLIEEKLRQAMADGEFDNLSGKGKPIDLTAYFATPEDLRLGYSILKNANVIPEEVSLLKEIEELKEKLAAGGKGDEQQRLKREIDDKTLKFNLLFERYRRRGGGR
jgi:hypothetical protein